MSIAELKLLENLISLQKAGLKWYWRSLAIIVTIASVVSAIYQILNFYYK